MRDPKFSKIEDQIDGMIAKGYVTEADIDAVYQKLDISYPEAKSYLNNRLAERQREEKLAAEENEILHKQVEASKLKSGKRGVVQTCPNCGATVQAGNAKCPECGYAFAGVEAVSSAAELDRRLSRIRATGEEADEQRAHIVSSFPIPNTREDMFEFLAATEQKAFNRYKDGEETALGKAYYEKFIEALNKAKISFPDDPATKMFEEKLAKDKKKIRLNLFAWLGIGIAIGIIGLIILGISQKNEEESMREAHAAEMVVKNEKYQQWQEQVRGEIEAYAEQMQEKLENLPEPTASNFRSCARKASLLTWSKSWPVPKEFSSAAGSSESVYGEDYNAKKAFEESLNSYKAQVGALWKADCKRRGLDHYETRNEIPDDYR